MAESRNAATDGIQTVEGIETVEGEVTVESEETVEGIETAEGDEAAGEEAAGIQIERWIEYADDNFLDDICVDDFLNISNRCELLLM